MDHHQKLLQGDLYPKKTNPKWIIITNYPITTKRHIPEQTNPKWTIITNYPITTRRPIPKQANPKWTNITNYPITTRRPIPKQANPKCVKTRCSRSSLLSRDDLHKRESRVGGALLLQTTCVDAWSTEVKRIKLNPRSLPLIPFYGK